MFLKFSCSVSRGGVLAEYLWAKEGLTWFPEGHVVPFLEVGRPEPCGLAHLDAHRPAEHGERSASPRRHTITSTL